jgi:hypothetical protein
MDTPGADMHGDDPEARREAARLMGKARSERKIQAARAVAESRRGTKWTEEQKAQLRIAQAARRERERLAREAAGAGAVVGTEKQRPGRPRTRPETADPDAPKRGPGRPRKQALEGQEQ